MLSYLFYVHHPDPSHAYWIPKRFSTWFDAETWLYNYRSFREQVNYYNASGELMDDININSVDSIIQSIKRELGYNE
jgi:hypothetical protein